MILPDVWNVELDFSGEMPVHIEPVEEHLCTDTGLLLFRQLDPILWVKATPVPGG